MSASRTSGRSRMSVLLMAASQAGTALVTAPMMTGCRHSPRHPPPGPRPLPRGRRRPRRRPAGRRPGEHPARARAAPAGQPRRRRPGRGRGARRRRRAGDDRRPRRRPARRADRRPARPGLRRPRPGQARRARPAGGRGAGPQRGDDGVEHRAAGGPGRDRRCSPPAGSAGCTASRRTPSTSRPTWSRSPGRRSLVVCAGREVDPRRPGHPRAAGDAVGHRRRLPDDDLPRLLRRRLRRRRSTGRSPTRAEAAAVLAARQRTRAGRRGRGQPAAGRRGARPRRCTTG